MPYLRSPINKDPMNELRLEDLAETIFEHMMESFKDLTPSEENLVYECALDAAVIQKTS
tara:strand:+ start:567 stop:743 length:177 start_codon:yes stop_codon:yes gene_type:complete